MHHLINWCTLLFSQLPAGIIFWQWSFAPYVDEAQLEGCAHCKAIQVGPADSVFTNVIVPTAEHAAKVAEAASPLLNCRPGALAAREAPRLGLKKASLREVAPVGMVCRLAQLLWQQLSFPLPPGTPRAGCQMLIMATACLNTAGRGLQLQARLWHLRVHNWLCAWLHP